jgi:AmpD protein
MINIDVASGWIAEARRVPSPNFDKRPDGCPPSLIILHGIALPPGEFGGPWIDYLFSNTLDSTAHPYFREIQDLKVSSHLLVRRDGQFVQYVSLHDRAWHAGESCYQGRDRCNDFSIGIELEGTDDKPYDSAQYQVVSDIIVAIRRAFPACAMSPVVGHCDVAPGRKTDPGPAFDWRKLKKLLGELD